MKLKNTVNIIIALLAFGVIVQADTINGVVNMDFVGIGNAGNLDDSTGFGGVSYDYRISTTEVTLNQYTNSGLSAQSAPFWTGANNPITGVSYHDAARYANWLTSGSTNTGAYSFDASGSVNGVMSRTDIVNDGGLFYLLATEDEWYKAAYYTGSGYSDFANGTGTIPSTSDANYLSAAVWDAGSGAQEQNGTYGMMGNVWEWMEGNPARRGGDYGSDAAFDSSLNKNYPRSARNGDLGYDDMGIRIVAIPEPGTISLMSISTIGLFLTRRVRRRKQLGESLLPVRRSRTCDVFDASRERHGYEMQMDEGFLVQLSRVMLQQIATGSQWIRTHYKQLDVMLWNHMVAVHERKLIKRKAFRKTCKAKALNTLDAFLASFMK